MYFTATLSDGRNLPDWLRFYSNNLTFVGVPSLADKQYMINLTAYD